MGVCSDSNTSLLLLLLLLSVLVSKSSSEKTRVQIKNDIEGYEVALDMHCMSNDDDLDHRLLHQGDEWYWEFKPSFIHTHFWCEFRWYDNWDYNWKYGTFVVYDRKPFHDEYYNLCGDDCLYYARRDGFYVYHSVSDGDDWEKRGEWHIE
ncbi:S-protein homolog 29-like [Papaver somniferum]|uniref:S-protein homolog 29-like n=1 Tax=Papaver somniferum TaxID=3469 RepID=UPI000E6FBE2E|nr:S-protein homolog 29-like [Papaver somniferum]